MKKIIKISSFIALFFAIILIAKAEGLDIRGPQTTSVTFPIAELGGCNSKQECKIYCDKAENISACAAFAQSHGLISQQEKQQADKLSSALKQGAGPGGCTDAASCSSYCSDASHTDECITFAQTHNLMPQEKINSSKKVGQALKQGAGPGGCKSDNECRTYCSKTENQQTCLAFAQSHGLVKQESVDVINKFSKLVKDGQSPGKCTTKEECQTYCQGQTHKDECAQFLVSLGVINTQAAEKIKQSDGKGPGGCTSKETCNTYCSDQTHKEECISFAKDRGLDVKPPKDNQGKSDNQIAPHPGDGGIKDCIFKTLGISPTSTLDTLNLTDDQKASLKEKCKPSQGQQGHDGKNEQDQGKPPVGNSAMKECVFKALGLSSTDTLDTSKLTDEQKSAMAKCAPQKGQDDRKQSQGQNGKQIPQNHEQGQNSGSGNQAGQSTQGMDQNNFFPGTKIPKEPLVPLNPGAGAPKPDQQSSQQPNQQPPKFPPFPK